MPWYLYLALKQLFPSGRKFPFFTAISVLGVALGVALLVVVTSVMGGFGYEIRRMIVDTEGEVQVRAQVAIGDYKTAISRIAAVPGVAAATPYATGPVGVAYRHRPSYPFLRGIDLDSVEKVASLNRFMRAGKLDDLDDDSVVLSAQLASSLGAYPGDKIEVYSPLLIEKLKSDEVLIPAELRVVGILEIGHQQLDSSTVYCTLRRAQDLYGLGTNVHGINVRVQAGANEDEVAARINAILPKGVRAFSWQDSFSEFLWVLNLEKAMIFFLLLFVVIVAAFSVTSSLLISVVRKTREIGLLGALGGAPRHVAACFCAQGLFIGVLGTLVGLALGFGALAMRQQIVLFTARVTQHEDVLQRFYQFKELPAHTATKDLVLIIVLTIVISTLAGLLPAWRAAKLKPVEALRSE